MDSFSACEAFGPLAIYLLLLSAINLSGRALVVRGTRETVALGLALAGLVSIGPMQLFMPQEAAGRFGGYVWLLLVSFYALCLSLVIILSRPRVVIYNIRLEALRGVLQDTARGLDSDATWAGHSLSMPLARVHLQIESFEPLGNVSLVATSDDQSIAGWRRLEAALADKLRETPVAGQPHGLWMALIAVAILAALTFWVADDPQAVAQGLCRMLNP